MTATGLGVTIQRHRALLDEQLRVASGRRRTGKFQKRSQRQGTADDNIDQLLNLIGMMR
jgi:hypothetical protein